MLDEKLHSNCVCNWNAVYYTLYTDNNLNIVVQKVSHQLVVLIALNVRFSQSFYCDSLQ